MKAFVLAEHSDAAQELCAGARTMADEVVLVAIADMEVPPSPIKSCTLSFPKALSLTTLPTP